MSGTQAVHVRFALFDQAYRASGGTYWTWYAPDLDFFLLDRFYYEIASSLRPGDPGRLGIDDLHGGCAVLNGQWCCWYRFVDGGRDSRGRPGRAVLVCAFVQRAQLQGLDGSGILKCATFEHVARHAPDSCPVSSPASLSIEYPLPTARGNVQHLTEPAWAGDARLPLEPDEGLAALGAFAAFLPASNWGYCQIERADGQPQLRIRVGALPVPEPVPADPLAGGSERAEPATPASHAKPIEPRSIERSGHWVGLPRRWSRHGERGNDRVRRIALIAGLFVLFGLSLLLLLLRVGTPPSAMPEDNAEPEEPAAAGPADEGEEAAEPETSETADEPAAPVDEEGATIPPPADG